MRRVTTLDLTSTKATAYGCLICWIAFAAIVYLVLTRFV